MPHAVSHAAPAIVLHDLTFRWPDGSAPFSGLTATVGSGRTGLIGANGSGKSTLLRLIAGELAPTGGSVSLTGDLSGGGGAVGYLPQQLTLQTSATVAGLLGIDGVLRAIRAIESGDADPAHFDVVGDDWDAQARARAALGALGLTDVGLDREVGTLSGGEVMLVALTGLRLARTPIVLLDEPTNNLDRPSRENLYRAITDWAGTLVVVSHDVELLDLLDATAELHGGALTVFGGPYTAYRDHVAAGQAAAEQALRTAQQTLKAERRQRVDAEAKLAHRRRTARTDYENKRMPKIAMNLRKSAAQVSAGKLRENLDDRVDAAQRAVEEQEQRIRRTEQIRIDLPGAQVPAGGLGRAKRPGSRRLAEFRSGEQVIVLAGSERIALTGRNGVGKTRLLTALTGGSRAAAGPGTPGVTAVGVTATALTDRIGYLPQRLDHLDDDATVFGCVRAAAPNASSEQLRAGLARFLFRGDGAARRVGGLSGGERFRVALARLLLADPPHELLVFDEPTNNLDLASVDELVDAVSAYRGGLLVVSHDAHFLSRLGLDRTLVLDGNGLSQA